MLTGQSYPILRRTTGSSVSGCLLEGLTAEHWRRLVWFEGNDYDLDPCRVVVDARETDARVFASENRPLTTGALWRLDHWQNRHKHDYLVRARVWMRQFERTDPLPDHVVWLTPLDDLHQRGMLDDF